MDNGFSGPASDTPELRRIALKKHSQIEVNEIKFAYVNN